MSLGALVTIDLHRGHLDPEVATLALPAERSSRLLADVVPFTDRLRAHGIPVIHIITEYRDAEESLTNPFWRRHHDDPLSSRKQMTRHNLAESPGTELMPGLYKKGDVVVRGKKRYDAFLGTDLEFVLRSHRIHRLYLAGVNTNSCVLATAIGANVRDFDVAIIQEGVSTMDSWTLHEASLKIVETAFGRVLGMDDVLRECVIGDGM
ncbi:MAG: cysteine hydrolase [Firmicutes bacterium]|nr:cysteine hydrolase [Bacillota bacterium]